MTAELLDAQGQTPEIDNCFEESTVKVMILESNLQSVAGLSGLHSSHLHAALCDKLVEDLAAFATLVLSNHVLLQVFWTLCTITLTFLRWGKRRGQWRVVTSNGELLAP